MSAAVVVRHNFETAHRLPFLGGKCTNLHGHSWWAEVTIAGEPDRYGVLLDFGTVKRHLREWIDTNLDHGTMLGAEDPLVGPLDEAGCKLFLFDASGVLHDGLCRGTRCLYGTRDLRWPTVENVAELLRRVTLRYLDGLAIAPLDVSVRVTETAVNAAIAAAALR